MQINGEKPKHDDHGFSSVGSFPLRESEEICPGSAAALGIGLDAEARNRREGSAAGQSTGRAPCKHICPGPWSEGDGRKISAG